MEVSAVIPKTGVLEQKVVIPNPQRTIGNIELWRRHLC